MKSIRPVRTGPINISCLFSVYSCINRENKFYTNNNGSHPPRLFLVYSGINRENKFYTNNGSHPVGCDDDDVCVKKENTSTIYYVDTIP